MPEPGLETRLIAKIAGLAQAIAILAGVGVVPGENVLLDEHEVGRRPRCRIIVSVMVVMVLMMIVIVVILMLFALMTATAYAAHDRSSG